MLEFENREWTLFAQGPKGRANLTLVQELYVNWDPERGNDIIWVRERNIDVCTTAINRYYHIPLRGEYD